MIQRIIVSVGISLGLLGLLSCSGDANGGSAGPGEAVLAWDAPTTNTDGSALTDLAGYRLYSGTASAAYGAPIDVGNMTEYHVTGLSSGVRYYFTVTAYDASGGESVFSNEVYKDIK